jgi:hypothetical protein
MTAVTIDREADLLGWRGWLRRQHAELNRWEGLGLSAPEIELVTLKDDHAGEFTQQGSQAVIRLDRTIIDGIGFLGEDYPGKLARARLLDVLRHEMAHQYQAEADGVRFTGDEAADHGRTFRSAAVRVGANPSRTCDPLLWRTTTITAPAELAADTCATCGRTMLAAETCTPRLGQARWTREPNRLTRNDGSLFEGRCPGCRVLPSGFHHQDCFVAQGLDRR